MLHHIASKSVSNREAMSDLVAVASFILKQNFEPLADEVLATKVAVARAGALPNPKQAPNLVTLYPAYNVNDNGDVYLDDMSPAGVQAATVRLSDEITLLHCQFDESNACLLDGWSARRRAALGLLGEVCLGVESNQALLRLSGGCEQLVGIVEGTGDDSGFRGDTLLLLEDCAVALASGMPLNSCTPGYDIESDVLCAAVGVLRIMAEMRSGDTLSEAPNR